MPPFSPILASLTRHKITALLLALQIGLTCAIVCNVAFMLVHRVAHLHLPSGVAEDELVMIDSTDLRESAQPLVSHEADLAALREIADVKAVAAVDAVPLNGLEWRNGISLSADQPPRALASAFNGTQDERAALGLHLVEGRDFLPSEYVPLDSAHDFAGLDKVSAAIMTRALADKVFPGQSPLGKVIYFNERPVRVVGIIDHLLRPNLGDDGDNEYATLLPMLPDSSEITYVLRTSPQNRQRVLAQAIDRLNRLNGNRILRHAQTFTQLRTDYFRRDRTMIRLLIVAATCLLFVTALGIAGLASFWVQQRRRSIGVRRAIGATRRDILRYFQAENFLIVTAGLLPGCLLAYALNLVLMSYYEQPRLPVAYLLMGVIACWLLGQLAVIGPALRAASVPPVVAVRAQ